MQFSELAPIRARAKAILGELCSAYPALRAYLVWSLPRGGQVGIDKDIEEVLRVFPQMFVDTDWRRRATELIALADAAEERARNEAYSASLGRLMGRAAESAAAEARARQERQTEAACRADLALLRPRLLVDPELRVELRFDELSYPLVWQLQRDLRVDRSLTPQTKASIRIVIGRVRDLAGGP